MANTTDSLISDIGKFLKCSYRKSVPGNKLTTFSIGGDLQILFDPDSPENLLEILFFLQKRSLPYKIIGAGSNLLIPDNGVQVPVIKLGQGFNYLTREVDCIRVGASRGLMRLSRELSKEGLSGLEFAGGIPGSVGGAVRMNAGAHGGQMSDIIKSLSYINPDGEIIKLQASDLTFSYRQCSLPEGSIVFEVELSLAKSDPKKVFAAQQENLSYRKETQPLQLPSAGSVFKNPLPAYAGELIENAGLKGRKEGGAEISSLHANWIVNPRKEASYKEVLSLINQVKDIVSQQSDIQLEPELVVW